jgi:hypothetical protein
MKIKHQISLISLGLLGTFFSLQSGASNQFVLRASVVEKISCGKDTTIKQVAKNTAQDTIKNGTFSIGQKDPGTKSTFTLNLDPQTKLKVDNALKASSAHKDTVKSTTFDFVPDNQQRPKKSLPAKRKAKANH